MQEIIKRCVLYGLEDGDSFESKNFSPKQAAEYPYEMPPHPPCPHFDYLIQVANQVFGLTEEEVVPTLCGHFVSSENSIGPLCGRCGESYSSSRLCERLRRALIHIITMNLDPMIKEPPVLDRDGKVCIVTIEAETAEEFRSKSGIIEAKLINRETYIEISARLPKIGDKRTPSVKETKKDLQNIVQHLDREMLDRCPLSPQSYFSGAVS